MGRVGARPGRSRLPSRRALRLSPPTACPRLWLGRSLRRGDPRGERFGARWPLGPGWRCRTAAISGLLGALASSREPVLAAAECQLGHQFHRSARPRTEPEAMGLREAHSCSLIFSLEVTLSRVSDGEQGCSCWLLLPSLPCVQIPVFCACVSVKPEDDLSEGVVRIRALGSSPAFRNVGKAKLNQQQPKRKFGSLSFIAYFDIYLCCAASEVICVWPIDLQSDGTRQALGSDDTEVVCSPVWWQSRGKN